MHVDKPVDNSVNNQRVIDGRVAPYVLVNRKIIGCVPI